MSATLGDVTLFQRDLTRRTGRETAVVVDAERPVPLSTPAATTPLHETIEELLAAQQAPIYVVHFTQAAAHGAGAGADERQRLHQGREGRDRRAIGAFRFTAGFGKTLSRLVRHGIGVHHAGMLPKYRRLVEQLAQAGLLKVICGTDTLGVGINVPIRTVLFIGLTKYDGAAGAAAAGPRVPPDRRPGGPGRLRHRRLRRRAGPRARGGERQALAKAGDDPKKRGAWCARKKPPEGFVSWTEPTFEQLVEAEPEPLTSSFAVTTRCC